MSTDPWCRKCPMFLECIQCEFTPQSICCDITRRSEGHLSDDDMDRMYPDFMELMIQVIDCF